ncbi:hypothetical protein Pan54_38800 [Rubinisphaera italica]|uniref:Transposase IS30-like HTH domain-containing protein n=1 Tax=Rubinisphaera italica TaxID=2527969 RepID=A0A5C5XKA3_9PLAN|nr:hypothetical protein Pan54_38800 [Rubinisphaera italica]
MLYSYLTTEERESIAHMHTLGHSRVEIDRDLSRDPCTISPNCVGIRMQLGRISPDRILP